MSDWEGSSDEESTSTAPTAPTTAAATTKPVPKKTSKWADEDAGEEVPDSWSASEDEAPAKVAPAKPKGPVRNKGITKQKILEKEAEEEARRVEEEARRAEADDPIARKRREAKRTLEADMENARGLFGDAVISNAGKEDPWKANPKTKDDFDELAQGISEFLLSKHGAKPLYPSFIESLSKLLSTPLTDLQTKKVASGLTTLANEKQRLAKEAAKKGGGKKAKPGLGGAGGALWQRAEEVQGADLESYNVALDDEFDDFM